MKKIKRVLALTAVVLWLALIIFTLICATSSNPALAEIFPGLIFTVIMLPIIVWAMMLVYKFLSKRSGR